MSRLSTIGHRLYTGEISYDFIGHRRRWYILSGILIAIAIISLITRGLDFGIEFKGGADFKAPAHVTAQTVDSMRDALRSSGVPNLDDATVNTIGNNQIRVQTRTLDPTEEVPKVRAAIAKEVGINPDQVAYSLIGASWGGQITERALIALGVFLTLVALVIWIYFRDAKMSAAALIALGHDVMLTIGIYALIGFTVTPATLIGLLTILGYSLYDTVVVFDKVRENVRDLRSSTTRTYSEAANLAINQALDQHHDHRRFAGGCAAVRWSGDLGRGSAEGPRARVVCWHGLGRVLLDLHRDTAAGSDEGAGARHEEAGRSGTSPPRQGDAKGASGRGSHDRTGSQGRGCRHDFCRGRRTEQRRTRGGHLDGGQRRQAG
jgi:preprotein translocase SecF subunit